MSDNAALLREVIAVHFWGRRADDVSNADKIADELAPVLLAEFNITPKQLIDWSLPATEVTSACGGTLRDWALSLAGEWEKEAEECCCVTAPYARYAVGLALKRCANELRSAVESLAPKPSPRAAVAVAIGMAAINEAIRGL